MGISTTPLWGRAWSLVIATSNGKEYTLSQESWDPEALRFTFDILQSTYDSPYWYADVTVYNLEETLAETLAFSSVWLTLQGGYQFGPSSSKISNLWSGPVLQVLFSRENVVDQTVHFNCMAYAGRTEAGALLNDTIVNVALGPLSSQLNAVLGFIATSNGNANQPLTQEQINAQVSSLAQQRLAAKQYPRGKTFFGMPASYISQACDDNYINYWRSSEGQHRLSALYHPSGGATPVPDFIYGPAYPPGAVVANPDAGITRSLIGVPRQFPGGCIFTVLLDPRMTVSVPPVIVELDQAVVQQMKVQLNQLPGILDKSGIYIVGQVRHYGDTRGNDWYSEVTGYTPQYAELVLNGLGPAIAGLAQ